MEDKEIFEITKEEKNALLYMYYSCLFELKHSKGLRYHQAFKMKKTVLEIANYLKEKNINDYVVIKGDN